MNKIYLLGIIIISTLLSNCGGTHTEYRPFFMAGSKASAGFGKDTCINGVAGAMVMMGVEVDDPVGIALGIGYDNYSLKSNGIPGYKESMHSLNYELGAWYLIPDLIKFRSDPAMNPMPHFGLNLGLCSLTDEWSQDSWGQKFSGSTNKSYFSYSPHIGIMIPLLKDLSVDIPDINRDALYISAIFHDIGYSFDKDNDDHAERSAEIFKEYALKNKFDIKLSAEIIHLINFHSNKELLKRLTH